MKKINLVTSLMLFLASGNLFAGSSTGKVTFLAVNDFSQVQVITETRSDDLPECVRDANIGRLVADLKTEHGRAMYSILLAAQAQGLDVRIGGKNSCNVRPGVETIQYIIIEP